VHASGHDAGDVSQPQGLQAVQTANVARGARHREDGAHPEAGGGAQEAAEAHGVPECHRGALEELQGGYSWTAYFLLSFH